MSRDNQLPNTAAEFRRARRANGFTLAQVAQRSRIPLALLQQLESGELTSWPTGLYGRTQLVRYARASGLDPDVVIAAFWPSLTKSDATAFQATGVTTIPHTVDSNAEGIRVIALEFSPEDELFASEEQRQTGPAAEPYANDPALELRPSRGSDDVPWSEPAIRLAEEPQLAHVGSSRHAIRPFMTAAGAALMIAASGLFGFFLFSNASFWRTLGAKEPVASSAPAIEPSDTTVSTPAPVTSIGSSQPPVAGTAGLSFRPANRAEGLARDAAVYSPTFAGDGKTMFYHARTASRSALMRADTNADGVVLRVTPVVADAARNFHARPSPDGTHIAFDSDRDGERAVYVADADGSRARRVSGKGYAAVPSWSPDGRSLVFVRAEPARPRVWNLWQLTLASGELRRLTSHPYGQPWGGSWFPDGQRIAYSHEDRIIVRDIARGTHRVYSSPRRGRQLRTPAVSPDGHRILFQVFRDGVWLLDVASGSMRKVLDDPSAEEYSWSPDGRRVAYHSRRSGQWGVWTMAAR